MMRRLSLIALPSALLFVTPQLLAEPAAAKPAAAKPAATKAAVTKPGGSKPAEPPKAEPAPLPDPNKAEAAQRFDRGLSLFNEGDNAGALAEFKQTYALMPNPIVLFNIGLVYAAMGRPVDAVDALNAVVDSATLSPEQRERATSTLSDQRARIGRVAVSTVPEGASIDVDGVEVAKTPLNAPLRVTEGTHVIGAVAEGYAHAHKEITVAGNADAQLKFELVLAQAKRPANLTVQSRIPDAEVFVDGQSAGKTPLATSISVPIGKHSVELRRPGYKTAKQDVEVGEGATGEVDLNLSVDSSALSTEGADLILEVREPNPYLTVDGDNLGLYAQPVRLPKGTHHVHIEVAGYVPFEQDVNLDAGKPTRLRPYLTPTPETRRAHNANVSLHRVLGWSLVGTGAAVAGFGGIWLGTHHSSDSKAVSDAQKRFDAAENAVLNKTGICNVAGGADPAECNANVTDAQAELDTAHKHANTNNAVSFIALGVGAAAIAGGIVVLLTGESSHRFDPPAANGASVKRSPLALTAGPGQIGLGLAASF